MAYTQIAPNETFPFIKPKVKLKTKKSLIFIRNLRLPLHLLLGQAFQCQRIQFQKKNNIFFVLILALRNYQKMYVTRSLSMFPSSFLILLGIRQATED